MFEKILQPIETRRWLIVGDYCVDQDEVVAIVKRDVIPEKASVMLTFKGGAIAHLHLESEAHVDELIEKITTFKQKESEAR